jgi:hypothetical protein
LLLFFSLPLFINETTAEGILGTEFFIWHRETFDLWDAAAQFCVSRRVPSAARCKGGELRGPGTVSASGQVQVQPNEASHGRQQGTGRRPGAAGPSQDPPPLHQQHRHVGRAGSAHVPLAGRRRSDPIHPSFYSFFYPVRARCMWRVESGQVRLPACLVPPLYAALTELLAVT